MPQAPSTLKRDLGLFAAITIVVGNMIGSGVFGLPAELAKVATPSVILLAWVVVSVGATIIALSYGNLSRLIPQAGGPVVYANAAMGKRVGYAVSLVWWIGSAVGNAAIVDLVFTQITQLAPSLNVPIYKLVITLAFLWTFTYINIRGVAMAGWISIVTTVLKVSVFVAVVLLAIPFFNIELFTDSANVSSYVQAEQPGFFKMFAAAMAMVFWAFTGLESSTMAGGEIKNPEKNIRRSVVYGLLIVGSIYVIINFSLMVLLPQEQLASSTSPFADAINMVTGISWGATVVNVAILISVVGALSGWVLTTARSVYAASKERFFIPAFARVHRRYSTPHVALIVSAIVTSVFFFLDFYTTTFGDDKGMSAFINVTTVASFINLPTYLITVLAEGVLMRKGRIASSSVSYLRVGCAIVFAATFIYLGAAGANVPVSYWIVAAALLGVGLAFYPLVIRVNERATSKK